MAITDPRRLLNGFTCTVDPFLPCYVRGCWTPAHVGRLHIRFGPVDSCPDHDPERHTYAKPFGHAPVSPPRPVAPAAAPEVAPDRAQTIRELAALLHALVNGPTGDGLDGGTTVPRRPVPPRLPPLAPGVPDPFGRKNRALPSQTS